ncbi:NAD(P)/FAD-dependent oxidoreductase [Desulfobacca acetoxidans]|uniref:Nitrite reductase (NAD(P)H) n=1 Tax=Desulfobacca acetoxidans (strain ATCC 700848 / DSM 11109 / ASRB2) TaxID=880072 RepID=F2NH13_DESAR|nr:NAD(P)/FAD-dependent oxidoreductase [Desulfobacca acetoxidans]AEB08784.1 Nitrite reductase (NAD(P)H) [Desulfobacca acetoxidans DSM 11109]
MAEDILKKGAILQRDKTSFAIAPHIPGGIITDFNQLRRLADVAEKYGVKAIKLTSAQRMALVGLQEADLDQVWQELGMPPGAAIGLCVRSVKICPGTTFCRIALQDAVKVGLALDSKYHGFELPYKFKMGVSGCPNSCAESTIKDVGLVGFKNGWRVYAGGFVSGIKPRLADVIADALDDQQALQLVDQVIEWYAQAGKKKRLGKIIDEVGLDRFKQDLGLS